MCIYSFCADCEVVKEDKSVKACRICPNVQAIKIAVEETQDTIDGKTRYQMTNKEAIEELKKKNAELELRLNKLINCLYPHTLGDSDIKYIDESEINKD